MDWGWGQDIKSHHTQHASRNLATVVVRGVLPGLRRRRTGLLPSGLKSSFQMRASFVFNLETKVLESGGRGEKLIVQVAWSPVLSFHSLWWFGVQCHLLVLVHYDFWKTSVTCTCLPIHFWSTSCFLLLTSFLKIADFIFQQDLAPATPAKKHQSWFKGPWCWCAWLAGKLTRPEPHRESKGIVKRKMRNKRAKNADELKATVKETWAFTALHKLITSMPRRIETVIKAKWDPTSIEYIYCKWTFSRSMFWKVCSCFLFLVLWSIIICWDSELVGFC